MTQIPEEPFGGSERRNGERAVAGVRLALAAAASLALAALLVNLELGYYHTYGCFFEGFSVWDTCPETMAGGVILLAFALAIPTALGIFLSYRAYRRFHPKAPA